MKNRDKDLFFDLQDVNFLTYVWILLLFCFAAIGWAEQSKDAVPLELDSYIADSLRKADVPGAAIAIVKDGHVLAKGYGVRRIGSPEPVDENTLFDAASLMKSFTAAAIGVLVDEGKLKLDDPVRKYLPWFEFSDPYLTAQVTIRDLLTHRVGIKSAHALFRFTGFNTREVLEHVRTLDPQAPFRTGVTYSNILYTAAGEAGASACGCTFAELVTTRILKPLGSNAPKWAAIRWSAKTLRFHISKSSSSLFAGGRWIPIPIRPADFAPPLSSSANGFCFMQATAHGKENA